MGSKLDDDAFSDLVRKEGEGLFRFLYWSLGQREDALDAVQETLLRAFRGLAGLRDQASVKRWLYRIATNVARDARSRRRRSPILFGLEAGEGARAALLGAGEAGPVANLEAAEADKRLGAALAALEPELREALLLRIVGGLKYREIAEALGWPIGTVATRINAARERLAKSLEG